MTMSAEKRRITRVLVIWAIWAAVAIGAYLILG
jgi:hypothetical protein